MLKQQTNASKKYLQTITKNTIFMQTIEQIKQPVKSCELGKLNKHNTYKPSESEQKKKRYELINIRSINKVFEPSWIQDQRNKNEEIEETHKKQVYDLLKKNQEITESLNKQRKSMSDLVYNLGIESHIFKQLHQHILKKPYAVQNRETVNNLKSKTPQVLPRIHNTRKQQQQNILQSQQEMLMIDNRHNKDEQKVQGRQLPNKIPNSLKEIAYADITNPKIKNFLRLKEHSYEEKGASIRENIKSNLQSTSLLKKKLRSEKKKLKKRESQKVRNSLQEYLETKMAPKEYRVQSLRTSVKDNLGNIYKTDKIKGKKIGAAIVNTQENKQIKQKQVESSIIQQLFNKIQEKYSNTERKLESKNKKKVNVNLILGSKLPKKNVYNTNDPQITIYEQKIIGYREFLFLINLAHNIFHPISLGKDKNLKNEKKYKFFIGKGNNSKLIRSLMKRRFWWIQTDDMNEANFVWTQLKVNSLFQKQTKQQRMSEKFYEIQEAKEEPNTAQEKQDREQQTKIGNMRNLHLYKAPLPQQAIQKILTNKQSKCYKAYIKSLRSRFNLQRQQNFENRRKFFPELNSCAQNQQKQLLVHNHLEYNYYIGNKKALFYNLRQYYKLIHRNVFEIIPLTFHIGQEGVNDPVFKQFVEHYKIYKTKKNSKNIWIVKPGENSNRGTGIEVFNELYEINRIIGRGNKNIDKAPRTYIIQKYIEKPLLYKGRKFDIRHYMMATKIHGRMKLYFYGQGYVRTSSSNFDLEEVYDNQIHLTNDAIQKHSDTYGKYQEANKISYTELQRYIDITFPNRKYSIMNEFYPKIKSIALNAFKACYLTMDPRNLQHNFEIFGLDFMIDSSFNVWLIEVNTNPCLQLSSNLLSRIIPTMIQHSLRLTIDPLFPPPCDYINSNKHLVPDNPLERLQYQLIFDEARDGKIIQDLYKNIGKIVGLQNVQEDQDTFDNDGKQLDIDIQ